MDNNADERAFDSSDSSRGFFATRRASTSSPLLVSGGSSGSPIVIFLGARLVFGAGNDKPLKGVEAEDGAAGAFVGGGRENVDFLGDGASLVVREAVLDIDGVNWASVSLPLSLP